MHHIVAHLQRIELRHSHLFIALNLAIDAVTAVAVENLMVGIEAHLQAIIHKTLVKRNGNSVKLDISAAHLVEDIIQTLNLRLTLREDIGLIPLQSRVLHIVG